MLLTYFLNDFEIVPVVVVVVVIVIIIIIIIIIVVVVVVVSKSTVRVMKISNKLTELGTRVRFPAWAWMSVSCECSVLSGRGLWDGPITRPEESYRSVMSAISKPAR
jgi:heme/copper-type cytochrome/quinol oxidase subunit 2